MEFIDQLNRKINLTKIPSRIVSLVPSQTELLVDLGLRDSIVGITKFCINPTDLRKEKTIVGGTKKVNFNKIRALNPDFIVCNKEENTEEMVLQLEEIAPVWVSDISTIPDCLEMIEKLGIIFEITEKASQIISKIHLELADFKMYMNDFPSKRVLYLIWKSPFMAAGKDTFIDSLLTLNNFENFISEENSRYPEVNWEDLKSVEVVLLSSEPYPFKEEHISEIRNKIDVEVKLVDGEYFSWYGTRLINAFDYFKTIH
ncbi:ABC-type Fe3+-hydroxamate transport system, periplasmic component [Aequorivita sublithincola DSM 14238]|uniref:ABC-type Fe3+-hydroxamate transport system, periplasmic component n=1 Tax=Aequorivita sublithincola (strain DSM 14238 / LMG 21431 / ACAM 643 / 9-3) TaxID=746697 RepID=I3YSE5_AEQSU|nr:helical backbone metal receptor [Aequorivita sublithincola]AFL79913.1 ABC-type Fe3+-hydroxamate transport system, periplasmic component [Aequorivita sublithincola DSM 14238]